jgi:hypothetical protein
MCVCAPVIHELPLYGNVLRVSLHVAFSVNMVLELGHGVDNIVFGRYTSFGIMQVQYLFSFGDVTIYRHNQGHHYYHITITTTLIAGKPWS